MPGLRDAVADGARTRMVRASVGATIGQIIKPPDAALASAVKSTGIFVLDRNLGGVFRPDRWYISQEIRSMSEIFFTPVYADTHDQALANTITNVYEVVFDIEHITNHRGNCGSIGTHALCCC